MGYLTSTDYEKDGPYDLGQDVTRDGTVGLRGQPSEKSKTGGWKATHFIHALIASDNFTSPGFAAVLQPYLFGTLHMSIAESSNTVANSIGVAYILAIFWGYVADSYIGKFYTIIIGAIICTSGWAILLISSWLPSLQPASCIPTLENPTCPRASQHVIDWFIAGLFIMSVGSAGLKPNITAMAKDQFDSTDPVETKRGEPFFTTYYWNLSAVVVVICTIIVYVQSNVSYRVGFSIQAGLYLLGVLIFFSGTLLFRHTKPTGSAFSRVVRVLLVALKNARKPVPSNASDLFEVDEYYANHVRLPKLQHTKRLSFLDKAAVKPDSWDVDQRRLPGTREVCTVTQVEELKTVLQILPIWVTTIVAFTLYSQIGGVTQQESRSLDRKWGPHFTFPTASAIVFLMISTIIFIPIYEYVVIPTLRRFTGHPRGLSLLKLMGIGLFLVMCAMIVAALVEQKRVDVIRNKNITLDQTLNGGVPMTVWWLLPQYILLGVSDIFLGVNMLIFFYTETPGHMKSIATSMYFASVSIGYFIASGVISTVNRYTKHSGGWVAGQFNTGGLRNYYYLLASVMAVNLVFFIIFAHFYTYKTVLAAEQQSIETNQVVLTEAENCSEV